MNPQMEVKNKPGSLLHYMRICLMKAPYGNNEEKHKLVCEIEKEFEQDPREYQALLHHIKACIISAPYGTTRHKNVLIYTMEKVFEKFLQKSPCGQETETTLPVPSINHYLPDSISDDAIVMFQSVESPNNTTHQTRKQSKPRKLDSAN